MTDDHGGRLPGEPGDELLQRVRAADPAAAVETDLAALRARVAERVEQPAGAEVRRSAPRPGPRWLRPVAAAAALVVVGSGGFLVGRHDGTTAASDTVVPAVALDTSGSPRSARGAGPSLPSDTLFPGPSRIVFEGSGLSAETASAHAWGFDQAAVATAQTAERLAAALGVHGTAQDQAGAWVVGATDGSGPSLTLGADAMASVSYVDPTRDPWCVTSVPGSGGPGAASTGATAGGSRPWVGAGAAADDPGTSDGPVTSSGPAAEPGAPPTLVPGLPVPDCSAAGPAPTGDAALAAARDVLTRLGVDVTRWTLTADSTSGSATWVRAALVVDGRPTDVLWTVTLVADGVQQASGPAAPVVDLGEYPLISPAQAVDRLADPRFAGLGGVVPLAEAQAGGAAQPVPAETSEGNPGAPMPTPTRLQPGRPLPWPVRHVTLTAATLGLNLVWLGDGAPALLPVYGLSSPDGSVWTVLAVAEQALDLAPAG